MSVVCWKTFSTFAMSFGRNPVDIHIESVFALSLLENLTVFYESKDKRMALISCLDKARCILTGMPVSHIYTSVGYCIVYFDSGFVRTF